jgi:predicted RNase H-like HicB family nuclease
MKSIAFPIQLTPESSGGYSATCPILPGCHSQGDTLEEAKANMREAIELVLEDMLAQGEPIPDPAVTLLTSVVVELDTAA